MGADGTIFTTADGGASWLAQSSGITQNINGVFFSDSLHGWAVGNAGRFLRTVDGGQSWAMQNLGVTFGNMYAVGFADVSTGWAVGAGGRIAYTDDGGLTWVEQTRPATNQLNDIFVGGLQFVPEPGTGLLCAGMAALAALGHRRRRA